MIKPKDEQSLSKLVGQIIQFLELLQTSEENLVGKLAFKAKRQNRNGIRNRFEFEKGN